MNAETENKSGVYQIRNKINNKRYAGSSGNIKNRWQEHKRKLRNGRHENDHLQRAWNKYGEENFEFAVIAYTDADKALAFEDYLLKNYPAMFEYNIARDATAPMLGRKHTEESKQKISEANSGENNYLFGKHHSEESRAKMSEAKMGENNPNFGKPFSEEHKRKISISLIDKPLSEEHRQKLSESHSGEKHYMFGKHLPEETKRKISEARKGYTMLEEQKHKISETKSGDKNPNWIDIPEEKMNEMKSLRAQGYTYEKIANAFGISETTVRRRLNSISGQYR